MKLALLLFFVINYSKSSSDLQILNFENKNIHVEAQQLNSSFKIIPKKGINLPNYLRIFVSGYNEAKLDLNHIISYYKDEYFEDRKQLAQSLFGTTTMWLTKKQIAEEFYLTVDCFEGPCNYTIEITPEDICKLPLHEQFTYYITKENQEMRFKINGTPTLSEVSKNRPIVNKNVITITAKGSKKIESNLEGLEGFNYVKHSLHSAYLIELKQSTELEPIEFILTVKGQLGDLITVGSFFTDGTDFNLVPVKNEKNGFEYTGFFKKNFKTQSCFRYKAFEINYAHNIYSWDNKPLDRTFKSQAQTSDYKIMCMDFSKYAEVYDEVFYTYHFLLFYYQKELIKYPVSYLGYNYRRILWINETIGLLTVMPDEDFNYLTYNVNNTYGSTKASLITCNNYPFCDVNKGVFDKATPLINYNSFSFSFNKNEIDYHYTSISKRQNLLLLYCDKYFNEYYCGSNQNIYSDKDVSFLEENNIYTRYSRKNNKEQFKINQKYNKDTKTIYLNVEKFTGDIDITINSNNYKKYNYENKKLFVITGENIEFEFYIKANLNSVYSISYTTKENIGPFMPGANYLLNLKDFKDGLNFNIKLNKFHFDVYNDKYYFDLIPISKCSINVQKENIQSKKYENVEEKYGFVNDIFYAKDRNSSGTNIAKYIFSINEQKDEECLFYVSTFQLTDEPDYNKIVLNNNLSRLFIFNENNYNMTYIYPVMELDNDVMINLNFTHGGKYHMKLFINDQIFAYYSIINSQKIQVTTTTFINYCDTKMNQVCKLTVNILSDEPEKESVLDIRIYNYTINEVIPQDPIPPPSPSDDTDGDKNNNNQNNQNNQTSSFAAGLGVSLGIIIIILIIAIILLLHYRRKSNYI